jgi:hypothetical protein
MIEVLLIVLFFILIIISGASEAVMDKLQFHWERSIFPVNPIKYQPYFWDPKISWKNKWSDHTYKKPKFLGSTTLFVFTTDAWHLFKFIRNTSIFLAMFCGMFIYDLSFLYIMIMVVSGRALYGCSFVLFFNKILEFNDPFQYIKDRRPGGGPANNQVIL